MCRTQTMPGSLLVLLSLLVLSTGSDARRIRKRGLNHKVGHITSPFYCTYECVYFSVSGLFRESFKVEVGESSQHCSTMSARLQGGTLSCQGSFVSEVRGVRVGLRAVIKMTDSVVA